MVDIISLVSLVLIIVGVITIIRCMLNAKEFVMPWYYLTPKDAEEYCTSLCPEENILRRIRAETMKRKDSMMISSSVTQQLFRVMLGLIDAKKGIDVGVYTGYSSTAVALQLIRNDEREAEVVALEYDEKNLDVAKRWWKEAGVDNVVKGVLGDARKSLDDLLEERGEGSFDFAFVDANKDGYSEYYEKLMKLIKVGGMIAFDNVLWKGTVFNRNWLFNLTTLKVLSLISSTAKGFLRDGKALKKLNERIKNDERVDVCVLPIDDGITIVRRLK